MEIQQASETMFKDLSSKRLTLLEYFFESFAVVLFLVLLLVTFALAFFPDFNLLTTGFCELRLLREINGESTLISFILFQTAIFLLFVSLLLFFLILSTFFTQRKLTKYLSWLGTFFGVAQCPINLTIFLERGTFEFHMIFVIIGPILLNLAVMIYTAVYFVDNRLPKISKYLFLTLSILAICFSIIIGIANSIGGTFNAQTQRLGNTIFNYLLVIVFILQGLVFYLILRTKIKNSV